MYDYHYNDNNELVVSSWCGTITYEAGTKFEDIDLSEVEASFNLD